MWLTGANFSQPFSWAAKTASPSASGAAENSPQFQLRGSSANERLVPEGRQNPPLFPAAPLGLEILLHINPQLKLRAIFNRRSATSIGFGKFRLHRDGFGVSMDKTFNSMS